MSSVINCSEQLTSSQGFLSETERLNAFRPRYLDFGTQESPVSIHIVPIHVVDDLPL